MPGQRPATYLFTDIEKSTVHWERQPVQMREAMAVHDRLVRECVKRHRGRIRTEKGEGDSVFGVFELTSDAVRAACAIQREMASRTWGLERPLRVRIGIHAGEVEPDDRGRVTNRCSRVRSLGQGGQVLLTAAAAEMVRESLPEGCELYDHGRRLLRGTRWPENVYELLYPGAAGKRMSPRPLNESRSHRQAISELLTSRTGQVAVASMIVVLLVTVAGLTALNRFGPQWRNHKLAPPGIGWLPTPPHGTSQVLGATPSPMESPSAPPPGPGQLVAGGGVPPGSGSGPASSQGNGGGGGAPVTSPGSGPGAVLLSDNFQGDQVGQPPAGWTVGLGTWTVQADGGNHVLHQADTDLSTSRVITAGSTGWTNYRVRVDLRPASNGSNIAYSINARYQASTDSRYSLVLKNGGVVGPHWYFGKVVSGTWSDLAVSGAYGYSAGNWYTLELDVSGSTISCYINGAQIATATDSSIASGNVGLRTNYTSDWGNVTVTAL